MRNKKTTISGYLVIGGAILNVIAEGMNGGDVSGAIQNSLLPALAGAGLISARDGEH